TEDLRARIAAVNRAVAVTARTAGPAPNMDLESLVPGESYLGPVGSFYVVRRALSEFRSSTFDQLITEYQHSLIGWTAPHAELDAFSRAFPRRVLYLDLETCGFSGAPLFLIGLVRETGGELVVEQLLARNYSEESAILAHLWDLLPAYDVLVTFNGKAFDWPFVLDRSTVHRRA